MKIKRLPHMIWTMDAYHPDYYGYIEVDIYINAECTVGERVICIVRKKDLLRFDNDACFDSSIAILCNDCGTESGIDFLTDLNAGQVIPIQFNGDEPPSVPLEWILAQPWKASFSL